MNRTNLLLFSTFAYFIMMGSGAWALDPEASSVVSSAKGSATLLLFYVLLALVISFLCSIAEAVLLSITPSFIESMRTDKPKLADKLQKLKIDNVDRSLAAILTLNTIAHTVGAIGAGAQAEKVFGSAWFGVFSAVMTFLVLVLSEIIPKTIGAVYWQSLTRPTVAYVNGLVKLLLPLVWMSEQLTKVIARDKPTHVMSRDEFLAMAKAGEATGEIGDNESRIIKNLMELNSLKVTDVMTPSTVIASLPEETPIADAVDAMGQRPFSRWPVYSADINAMTGFILRNDVLLKHAKGESDGLTVAELKRDIARVSNSDDVSKLLEMFLRERLHIAIVIDEHGGTRGLVTLEDLIETLIGVEIMDEVDTVQDMRQLARKLWEERARGLGISIPEQEPTADPTSPQS